jgi:2,4-dienoyl-CoA reductase-like NADH-dependent reductase (Old Yellow Enzyme family)
MTRPCRNFGSCLPTSSSASKALALDFCTSWTVWASVYTNWGKPITLEEVRPLISGVLIGNVGNTQESAEEQITAGHADMIALGRPCITNPDSVERFENDWPLAREADMSTWYTPQEGGYTDWPACAR